MATGVSRLHMLLYNVFRGNYNELTSQDVMTPGVHRAIAVRANTLIFGQFVNDLFHRQRGNLFFPLALLLAAAGN